MKTVPAKAGTVVSGAWKYRPFRVFSRESSHTMNADQLKQQAALAALTHVEEDSVLGIGTGSTVDLFIDALAAQKLRIRGAVSSSERSTTRLKRQRHRCARPQYRRFAGSLHRWRRRVGSSPAPDQGRWGCVDPREDRCRRIAALHLHRRRVEAGRRARQVSIAGRGDSDGALVCRPTIGCFRGQPVYREGFVTDNGNQILDVHGLSIVDPVKMESELNQLVGVVTVGLFARRACGSGDSRLAFGR